MLKRSILFNKKIVKFKLWHKTLWEERLMQSFQQNHFNKPTHRLSFFLKKDYYTNEHMFYKSQNRLHCFLTYSLRVPNSKVLLSRFYLNKGVDRLMLSNYQK